MKLDYRAVMKVSHCIIRYGPCCRRCFVAPPMCCRMNQRARTVNLHKWFWTENDAFNEELYIKAIDALENTGGDIPKISEFVLKIGPTLVQNRDVKCLFEILISGSTPVLTKRTSFCLLDAKAADISHYEKVSLEYCESEWGKYNYKYNNSEFEKYFQMFLSLLNENKSWNIGLNAALRIFFKKADVLASGQSNNLAHMTATLAGIFGCI